MRIVCWQTIHMKYHALFLSNTRKEFAVVIGTLRVNLIKVFQKILSGTLSECQTAWIEIRTDILLLVLIWIQTVCKGYQQMSKIAASNERVKSSHINEPALALDFRTYLKCIHNHFLNMHSHSFLVHQIRISESLPWDISSP